MRVVAGHRLLSQRMGAPILRRETAAGDSAARGAVRQGPCPGVIASGLSRVSLGPARRAVTPTLVAPQSWAFRTLGP